MNATLNGPASFQAKVPSRIHEGGQSQSQSQSGVGENPSSKSIGVEAAGATQPTNELHSQRYLNPVEEINVSAEAREVSTATHPDQQSVNGHSSIQALLGNFSLCGNLPNRVEPVSKSQEAKSSEEAVKAFDGKALSGGQSVGDYSKKLVAVGSDSSSTKLDKNPGPAVTAAAELDVQEASQTTKTVTGSDTRNLKSTFQPSQELLESRSLAQADPACVPGKMVQAHLS